MPRFRSAGTKVNTKIAVKNGPFFRLPQNQTASGKWLWAPIRIRFILKQRFKDLLLQQNLRKAGQSVLRLVPAPSEGALGTANMARIALRVPVLRIRRYKAAMSSDKADPQTPFWRRKAMSEMTRAEWESLCDGCGRCCLNKLIDEDTNATVFTDVSCMLLDCQTCRCSDYTHRQAKVKDCVRLTPRNVRRLKIGR